MAQRVYLIVLDDHHEERARVLYDLMKKAEEEE